MKNLRILIPKDPAIENCPNCNASGRLRRSRRRTSLEGFIKTFTMFNIYRCKSCDWRGYKSGYHITKTSFKTLGIYLLVALISGMIIRVIISKFVVK
ncbi:MAG: hypothetical protein JEY94_15745 [Melioribacteraceae bacterium]|nr:hypothetical protein [Melioribacteraceae bacterium]